MQITYNLITPRNGVPLVAATQVRLVLVNFIDVITGELAPNNPCLILVFERYIRIF